MNVLALHEEYVNGLVRMASACSTWIGCSEISAACFSPEKPIAEQLAEEFGTKPEQMALTPVKETLSQVFAQWLGGKEEKLRDGLLWLLHARLGDPGQVYRLKDEEKLLGRLGWGEDGKGYYYFVEDVIVVSFAECTVCFYLGNNE
ncbi:MAG: hypothetical protein IJK89_01320 [Clostridia bacterium]|nr:hypothetical protein [Clostridia bacterium]